MRVVLDGARPDSPALLGGGLRREHAGSLAPDLNLRAGVGAQVMQSAGVVGKAALGSDDDEVVPVGHVDERRRAPLAGLCPYMVEQQQRWQARHTLSDASAGRPVDSRVTSHHSPEYRPAAVGDAKVVGHMRDATQVPERQGDPSRTAEFVALFRALESRMPTDRRLFVDPYAHAFLGPRLGAVLALTRVPVTGGLVVRVIDRGWPGARVGIVVRTRFIDDAFVAALADGIDQIVILGSGFDTRAYRLPGLERARVCEIDAPATLQIKRMRMEALLGQLPPHVSMGAMDFERDDLGAALSRTEFRARAPTLFVWEGVTSYLSAAAVDAMVRHLATLAAPRSRLVFTYLDRSTLEGRSDVPGARATIATVRHAGEPFRFGFDPAELPAYLDQRGFELLEDFSTAELAVRYLHPVGRRPTATRFYHVALATR